MAVVAPVDGPRLRELISDCGPLAPVELPTPALLYEYPPGLETRLLLAGSGDIGGLLPPYASSIPALLQTLQNEWDAAMLEVFALKQQNNSLKQELSVALYTQDAATRVVARLIKERDAARE